MRYKRYISVFAGIFLASVFAVTLMVSCNTSAKKGRWEQKLSGSNWSLWLDKAASWYDDEIFMPPVDISKLPINPPSGGWDALRNNNSAITVDVPGTVEQHYWGQIGGATAEGDYVGVSWWSRKFYLPENLKGKRITLAFASVNLRAEVFVNGKLVGYDVIGNSPFEVNATDAVLFGQDNYLDIRVTDPVGNFSWDDNTLMRWGNNLVPAVRGFGGVTGEIILRATDAVVVSDIYVQNQPDPKSVNIIVTLDNYSGNQQDGQLEVSIRERGVRKAIWTNTSPVAITGSTTTVTIPAHVPDAKLWEVARSNPKHVATLYDAEVIFTSSNKIIVDNSSQRFGFRWFSVGEKNGDKRFYLNGRRVFLIAARSRGIAPATGKIPTPAVIAKEIKTMHAMGYNMMMMNRAIGRPEIFDYADSFGFFTSQEPGGFRILANRAQNIDGPDEQAFFWRREKTRRMIIRDRSLPSQIIYGLKNEEVSVRTDGGDGIPDERSMSDMRFFHSLDPSRYLKYNTGNKIGMSGDEYYEEIPDDPMEIVFEPFNPEPQYYWWDHHHWYAYSGYTDEMYRNPQFYRGGTNDAARVPLLIDSIYRLNPAKILYSGEEGAFSAMVRLQKIKEQIENTPASGYRELEHLDWYYAYDQFLDETGFRKAYPNVDSLTVSMGRNIHYYQARNLENMRISNINDAYVANGWAAESTRTDIVDAYRNPTSHPSIFRHYTQQLFVAVKLRNKVIPAGFTPIVDFFIVNEANLNGSHTLNVTLDDPDGNIIFRQSYPVNITGGEEFGELLVEGVQLPVISRGGHFIVKATITDARGSVKTTGFDEIYSVDLSNNTLPSHIAVLESDATVGNFLLRTKGINVTSYSPEIPDMNVIVVGTYNFDEISEPMMSDLFNRVQKGTKLIVLSNADRFAQQIDLVLKTRPFLFIPAPVQVPRPGGGGSATPSGIVNLGGNGRFFVGINPVLTGLPQAEGMSWEYQCFYKGARLVMGDQAIVQGQRLNWFRTELIVGLGNAGSKEILSALSRVPVGEGSVTLSTLNMVNNLRNDFQSAAVAKKLFLNLLEY